ncbi:hypothetical protein ABZY23_32260, partial [Streptomyces sp. NPDC006638]
AVLRAATEVVRVFDHAIAAGRGIATLRRSALDAHPGPATINNQGGPTPINTRPATPDYPSV